MRMKSFALIWCSVGFSRFLGPDAVNRECWQPSILVFRCFQFSVSPLLFHLKFQISNLKLLSPL